MVQRERGQAAVEAALVMPLAVFLVLGVLQLFLLQQSRILAQYAAFQAARTGAVSHGACGPMTDAALLAVLPNVHSFLGDRSLPGSAAQKMARAFRRVRENHYQGFQWGTWQSPGTDADAIVWLVREGRRPSAADVLGFDQPLSGGAPLRMELRLTYWAPLRVPFADWVYARIAAAQMGLQSYGGTDPLMPTRRAAGWEGGSTLSDTQVADEFRRRVGEGHYTFPITVSSSMRMMTPPRLSEFGDPRCPAPGFF